MANNNNFLLIITILILLVIVLFFFDSISGLVVSNVEGKLVITPSILEFDRYDSSNVVNIQIDTGSDSVGRYVELKSAKTGEVLERDSICDSGECGGKISKNFVIDRNIESGDYYFELDRVCKPANTDCESLNPKMKSSVLEIRHI